VKSFAFFLNTGLKYSLTDSATFLFSPLTNIVKCSEAVLPMYLIALHGTAEVQEILISPGRF
jgi:hypothetical protein